MMEYQGFWSFFSLKMRFFPYMGPPGPQNYLKNHVFRPAGHPPPKIIKNRLNFAHSEKFKIGRFLPNFVPKLTILFKQLKPRFINEKNHLFSYIKHPPPKIIKNRLNFASSEKSIFEVFL